MRSQRVTTETWTAYDESTRLDAVPEAVRPAVAEKKLWRIKTTLQTDLRVAANYLAELQQFDAWRLFKCGSMAEFVEQRGLRLDHELVAEIRSRLHGGQSEKAKQGVGLVASSGLPHAARRILQAVEWIAEGKDYAPATVVKMLRESAGSMAEFWRAWTTLLEVAADRFDWSEPVVLDRDDREKYRSGEDFYRREIGPLLEPLERLLEVATKKYRDALPADVVEEPAVASRPRVVDELVDADALLDELKAAGVRVEARGDRLALLPASAVDDALVARVRPHKAALLALLAARSSTARRGDRETWEEARLRVAAAEDRLRRDREEWIEAARKAGVYRGLAASTGGDVP